MKAESSGLKKQDSSMANMKRTLSMRKENMDPREKEITEMCDKDDELERQKLVELQNEFKKVTGFRKLMPFQKPKYALYLGVLFLAISQVNTCFTSIAFGTFMSLLGTPLDSKIFM